MRQALIALVLLLPGAAPSAAQTPQPEPPGVPADVEFQAARALAIISAGEPDVESLQRAAAREADRTAAATASYPGRARVAALLPRFTAEYRHDQADNRVVGLQGSGEVDYSRLTPSDAFLVRATWELPWLLASPGELAAAAQAEAHARRRSEAVERVTRLFFERRRLRVALLLSPPLDPLAHAQLELEIAQAGAEIDALTGGRHSERAP